MKNESDAGSYGEHAEIHLHSKKWWTGGALVLMAAVLASCSLDSEPQQKGACKTEYGVYMSLAPNGDFAIDHCRYGRFGILIKTSKGERRLVSDKTIYMNPAFSPDGKTMAFIELNWPARSSSIHLLDINSGELTKVFSDKGAISHAVVTSDRKTIYFWHGTWRETGGTAAAGFVLRRLTLPDGKLTPLDGPHFIAEKPALGLDGSLYFVHEIQASGQYLARRIPPSTDQALPIELPKLSGPMIPTARGDYYVARYKVNSIYAYCIVGPSIEERSLCPGKEFAVNAAGTRLVYVNKEGKPTWIDLN